METGGSCFIRLYHSIFKTEYEYTIIQQPHSTPVITEMNIKKMVIIALSARAKGCKKTNYQVSINRMDKSWPIHKKRNNVQKLERIM